MIRKEVCPGIALTMVNTEKFKENRLALHFILPLVPEEVQYYAVLSKILKHGSRAYPSMSAFARQLETLYASNISCETAVRGETEIFTVSLSMLRNRCTGGDMDLTVEGTKLLTGLLSEPLLNRDGTGFDEKNVAMEKANFLTQIRSIVNNKALYAMARCREEMCKGEPYATGALGTEEMFRTFDDAKLLPYFKKLLHASRVEAVFIGDEPEDRISALCQPLFTFLGARQVPDLSCRVVRTVKEVKHITESADTVQGKLSVGFRTGVVTADPISYAYPMFSTVLSASPVSKFFMNVREKRSLCYYCSMSVDREKGVAFVNAGIANDKKEETVSAVLEEIEAMKKGEITDEEMRFARSFLIDNYRSVTDSLESMDVFCLGNILRNEEKSVDDYIDDVNKTTKEDLMKIADGMLLDTVYFLRGSGDRNEEDSAE